MTITVPHDRGSRCVNPESEKAPLPGGRTKEHEIRGVSDEQIEKILRGNWLRIFEELL